MANKRGLNLNNTNCKEYTYISSVLSTPIFLKIGSVCLFICKSDTEITHKTFIVTIYRSLVYEQQHFTKVYISKVSGLTNIESQ